jgi:hypothetical protein
VVKGPVLLYTSKSMSDPTPAPEMPSQPPIISPANKGRVVTGFLVSIFLIIIGSIIAIYLSQIEPPQGGVQTRALLDPPASPQQTPSPFPLGAS